MCSSAFLLLPINNYMVYVCSYGIHYYFLGYKNKTVALVLQKFQRFFTFLVWKGIVFIVASIRVKFHVIRVNFTWLWMKTYCNACFFYLSIKLQFILIWNWHAATCFLLRMKVDVGITKLVCVSTEHKKQLLFQRNGLSFWRGNKFFLHSHVYYFVKLWVINCFFLEIFVLIKL